MFTVLNAHIHECVCYTQIQVATNIQETAHAQSVGTRSVPAGLLLLPQKLFLCSVAQLCNSASAFG